jgi:hypothetical protein
VATKKRVAAGKKKPGMRSRAPWSTKLRPDLQPKVVANPRGGGRMLVPTPMLVAEEIRRVHARSLVTPAQIRERLAAQFGAALTCPLTTGIFLNIIAGAAEEDLRSGREPLAPYWRVIGADGSLSEKFPPGPARQARHLRSEGHRVARSRRGGWRVTG